MLRRPRGSTDAVAMRTRRSGRRELIGGSFWAARPPWPVLAFARPPAHSGAREELATKMNVQDVLNDKIAQELLTSTELARLAYTWRDGTPRVVPDLVPLERVGSGHGLPGQRSQGRRSCETRPRSRLDRSTRSSPWPYHVL